MYQGKSLSESGRSGSGGGLSSMLSAPSYQQRLTIHKGNSIISANGHRAGPDVAFDFDPNTGVAVYGTYGWGGWAQVGGTSAAAPQWAALVAVADQGRALAGLGSLDGYTQTLPAIY
jgi:subtilase family serine protease